MTWTYRRFGIYALQVCLHDVRVNEITFALAKADVVRVVALPLLLKTVVSISTQLACMYVPVKAQLRNTDDVV